MDKGRIPALDGLRAVAVALVMISHGFILGDTSARSARAMSYAAGQLGGIGVSLFFAISGFLITTLLLRERKENGRISLKGFYIRRAFRILPAAYAYLAFLAISGVVLRPGEGASAAFFFSNYWEGRTWFTQHFWSLSMEEHFYFLWPVTLAVLGARGATKTACAVIAATILWRPWSLAHVHLPFPALQRTDMRLDAFLFSCLLAICLQSEYAESAIALLRSTRFRIGTMLLLAGVWAAALIGSIPATGTLLQSALAPLVLGSLVYAPGSWIFGALESAPLRWMGGISYGLYLWQQFFLVAHAASSTAVAARLFFPRVAAIFTVATISYYAMERDAQSLGRSLSHSASSAPRLRKPDRVSVGV